MTRELGPAGPRRTWAATGQASRYRSVIRSRGFGRSGAPGGSGGRGPLFGLLIGTGVVAFAVGLTIVPIAMSGSLVGLPAFAPQQSCSQPASQLVASKQATDSIPANYLADYQKTGAQYGIPWEVLAGIGEVESNHGRANVPGVRSGQNGFGAAGPMQIGIGGAAGDEWGGLAIHPASQSFGGVATDGNGDGIASVYDPADAIPGAAKYLLAHGAPGDLPVAIFAYNHLESYVQDVLSWASTYTKGGFTVTAVNLDSGASCIDSLTAFVPNHVVSLAISYAQQQLGKPYLWGGTGPEAFDCSGLVMMAYRAAGITIPRTSEVQWTWGPQIQPGHEQPGDLVFFVGADGTRTSPGHVGMVLGKGMMIEAEQTGVPVHIVSYKDRSPIGFSRPWAHSGITLPG
jgi:cell wall-associated NlpC family hydrolase